VEVRDPDEGVTLTLVGLAPSVSPPHATRSAADSAAIATWVRIRSGLLSGRLYSRLE
jgi:hypothetical protein